MCYSSCGTLAVAKHPCALSSAALPFDGLLFLQNETNSYAFCSGDCTISQLGWYLQNAVLYKMRPKYSRVNEMNKEGGCYGRGYA